MADTAQRLRDTAAAFELAHAPHHVVLHMRAAADEIERLRAGGCARDQGTTQYCAEAARLVDENEKFREALTNIYRKGLCHQNGAYKRGFYDCFAIARRALGIPHMSFDQARAALAQGGE